AFIPDGRYLLTGGRDKTVKVWDVTTGACVRTLAYTGAVLTVAVLPSGNAFLCAGTDLALRVWRLEWETDERAMRSQTAPKARPTLQPLTQPDAVSTVPPSTGQTGLPKAGPTLQARPTSPNPPIRLKPVTMAPTLQPALRTETTAWDDIRKAAPRAAAREAAVQAARSARRALPSAKTIGLVAAVAVALIVGVLVFWPRHARLGVSHHQSAIARKEIDPYVVNLAPFAGGCADGYDQYLERARARVVSEETLACLLQLQQPGLVDAYLQTVDIEDPELTIFDRKRRNAVSLMVGLGEPAIPDLCRWVAGGGEAG